MLDRVRRVFAVDLDRRASQAHPGLAMAKDDATEQEGFEPPVPFGTVVFKTTEANPQMPEAKGLTDSQEAPLQTSLQRHPQNDPNQPLSLPPDLAEIVAVWPKLPEHIKAAVTALVQTHVSKYGLIW